MAVWTLAKKELRLMVRDVRAALLLLAMPFLFILILGLLLGETFGQKPDDRIRFMIVDLDQKGVFFQHKGQIGALLAAAPVGPLHTLAALQVAPGELMPGLRPGRTWAEEVRDDLKDTADIRIDIIGSREEAERLVQEHRQAAVLIFEPGFSDAVNHCSFLTDGINPFYRDGVYLDKVQATLLKDGRQPGQAAIIEQVAQVSLLRVILPYMIGKAFTRLSQPEFVELLGNKVELPVPPTYRLLVGKSKLTLSESLAMAAENKPAVIQDYRGKVGSGVQEALRQQFSKYDLTGMTWAKLTRSRDAREDPVLGAGTVGLLAAPRGPGPLLAAALLTPERPELPPATGAEVSDYTNKNGSGLLNRGAQRYQLLVPSYTVMFSFFMVLLVGWLFVTERRQGTLKRLRAAPITRGQVLLGKFLPRFALALGQGILLMLAGKLVFGMRWGPAQWSLGEQVLWLLPVVATTSLAATGLALLVAAVARTEIQVALYGAIPVLILALVGGCVLPPELMPEKTQQLTWLTPHGWALGAYRELFDPDPNARPDLRLVLESCGVLSTFGVAFTGLAWGLLRLD